MALIMFLAKSFFALIFEGFIKKSPLNFGLFIISLLTNLCFLLLIVNNIDAVFEPSLTSLPSGQISINFAQLQNLFIFSFCYLSTNNYLSVIMNILCNAGNITLNIKLCCPEIFSCKKTENIRLEPINPKLLNTISEFSFAVPVFLKLILNDIPSVAILISVITLFITNPQLSEELKILTSAFFFFVGVLYLLVCLIHVFSLKASAQYNSKLNLTLSEIGKDLNLINNASQGSNNNFDQISRGLISKGLENIKVNFVKTIKIWKNKSLSILSFELLQFASIIFICILVLTFIKEISNQSISTNNIFVFVVSAMLFHYKLSCCLKAMRHYLLGILHAGSMIKSISGDITKKSKQSKKSNFTKYDKLCIENLSLKIQKENKLKDINLEVEIGEKISIIYNNLEEANQLISVLCGEISPTSGNCYLAKIVGKDNNKNIRTAPSEKDICIVSEDAHINKDSIKNNILLGKKLDDEVFDNIVKISGIRNFISSLPREENTIIDCTSSFLTKDLIKKISFARSLITDKSIILFKGLNLTNNSNESISESFINIAKRKICIIFTTNPLETIFANKIYVLNAGEIVEKGTHKDLLAIGGIYCNTYIRFMTHLTSNNKLN